MTRRPADGPSGRWTGGPEPDRYTEQDGQHGQYGQYGQYLRYVR